MKELTFELLLDKYRKELINLGRYTSEQQKWYWKARSDDTYNRLIKMYHEQRN